MANISVAQAIRLLGITRTELQERIRLGEIHCFEGKISCEELMRCYPHFRLEDSTFFERVQDIKEKAFARRVKEAVFPPPEEMAEFIKQLRHEIVALHCYIHEVSPLLVVFREHCQSYEMSQAQELIDKIDALLAYQEKLKLSPKKH